MQLLVVLLIAWAAVSLLGLVGATAVCRSGHLEDVARGFSEPEPSAPTAGIPPLPQPTPAGDEQPAPHRQPS